MIHETAIFSRFRKQTVFRSSANRQPRVDSGLGSRVCALSHGKGDKADLANWRSAKKLGTDENGLAGGMRGVFGERAHENPASLPGKRPKKKENAG
jgi:hypothetical protein